MGNPKGITVAVTIGILVMSTGHCSKAPGPSTDAIEKYRQSKGVTRDNESAPSPQGRLAARVKITVVKGKDLRDTDPMAGDPDAYVILDYEGQRHQTAHVQGSTNPRWGDSFLIDVEQGGMLTVKVMDKDAFPAKDDLIGSNVLAIPGVAVGQKEGFQVPLSEGAHGTVHLEVTGLSP